MLLTRYDPFKNFENRFLRTLANYEEDKGIGSFAPSVNISQDQTAYHVDVDLPGVNKEDIKVDVNDGQLIITGERNLKVEIKEEDYHKIETNYGKFSRTFNLPENVDLESIDASCENGVLSITIPRLEEVNNQYNIKIK